MGKYTNEDKAYIQFNLSTSGNFYIDFYFRLKKQKWDYGK